MPTYVTMEKSWVSATDAPEGRPSCEVWETEKAPVNTGLLTADGTPIYRMPTVHPIGFCRDKVI